MVKAKYSFTLPLIQLLLAVVLWKNWVQGGGFPNPSGGILVYYGINAPALAFKALAIPLRDKFGFWPEQILFFLGVIIVWFLVGKAFDRYRWNRISGQTSKLNIAATIGYGLIMAAGIAVLIASVSDVDGLVRTWGLSDAARIFVGFTMAWSLFLIAFPATILWTPIRAKRLAAGRISGYVSMWARYKMLRNAWIIVFLTGLAGFDSFVGRLIMRVFPIINREYTPLAGELVWLVALFLIGDKLWKWKCPRCSKLYAGGHKIYDKVSTSVNWLFLPKQCVSCGLPKYANDPLAGETGID